MRRANTGQPPRHNPPAFRHELGEQSNVLVVDSLNLFDAELANFLAPEILATTTAAFATTTGSAWTRRGAAFAAIGSVAARR
jgi:hypothetical protein